MTAGGDLAEHGDGGAVDHAGEPRAVPVDQPAPPRTIYGTVTAARTAERRPIVPAWLRNRQEAADLAAYLAKHGAHVVAFHVPRIPMYAALHLWYSPRGMWRIGRRIVELVFDAEGAPLRAEMVLKKDSAEYQKLVRIRDARVRRRGWSAIGAAAFMALALVAALFTEADHSTLPTSARLLVVAVLAVTILGRVGQPADRPLVASAVVASGQPSRLTSDVVTRALRVLGISEMNKKGAEIGFAAPITRDGPGWRADVDLPYGVTPQDVMEKRRELASGLRRPLGCVWPEPATEQHAGRLVLWVGDQDLAKMEKRPWPLAQAGTADLFGPVPFGTDQRGRPITVTLMFANMVIGSIPRVGKTFALRLLLLAAALDPRVELHAYDLKGTGDLSALEPVAHAYRAGDDVDDIEYAVEAMRALATELRRRTKVIQKLPRDLCPENKVTPELAGQRALGLHPIVLGVDECQRWFENAEHGKELTAIAEDLVRRGPATGIIALFATQRPDAKSLPTGISGNAILRFALKVMDHTANDMVLGTSAHKNGIKATMFTRLDLGIGWLSGEEEDPKITRTYYVDQPGAEAIVTRARAARERLGTITGYAAGDRAEPAERVDVLEDLRVVFATATVERIWSERACELLAQLRPQVYGGWTPEALAAALRPHGVAPGQQWAKDPVTGKGANRNGYALEQLVEAIQRREIAR